VGADLSCSRVPPVQRGGRTTQAEIATTRPTMKATVVSTSLRSCVSITRTNPHSPAGDLPRICPPRQQGSAVSVPDRCEAVCHLADSAGVGLLTPE
jgi:hypothetical protein